MSKLRNPEDCVQMSAVRALEISNAVLKTQYTTMVEDIKEVKVSVRNLSEKFDKFIDSVDDKYVSKVELNDKLTPIYDRIEVNKTAIGKVAEWIAKYGPSVAIMAYILFGKGLL